MIANVLLDVNIVVDVCAQRAPFNRLAVAAIQRASQQNNKLWLYAGSVQTLEYNLAAEVKRRNTSIGRTDISNKQLRARVRQLLETFAQDKQWLAALAHEGNVYDSPDPEDEQLIRALARFERGSAKLLTRDQPLMRRYPELTVSPEQYLQLPEDKAAIPFIDLAAQQNKT